jgi:hypothetical protein
MLRSLDEGDLTTHLVENNLLTIQVPSGHRSHESENFKMKQLKNNQQ